LDRMAGWILSRSVAVSAQLVNANRPASAADRK
jgi:hypothetical protein